MNQPLSGNKSEKSWTDFMQLLKTNNKMMDTVDAQLAEIWGELVSADEHARGPQKSVEKLSEAVTELLQQKREAEIAIAKLAEVLGSRVFLTGKMTDDAVQFVSKQLQLELDASQTLVEKVRGEKHTYKKEEPVANVNGNSRSEEIAKLLRQQLQDKEEQLQASQAAVAKLKDQLARQKETGEEKQIQFERALEVKLREIDALCSAIDLPVDYERAKTAEGIPCYRRKGGAGNDLEDPRVPIALQQRADKVTGPASTENINSGSTQRPRGISAMARDYAAPDNIMRRSFSTPHISHDSNAFEDIHVPPDDGHKHTIEDFSTPLPAGWEMRVTASGAVFFFNKYTTTTTWTDPRLLGSAPSSSDVFNQHKPLVRNSSATTAESPNVPDAGATGGLRPLTLTFKRDLNRTQAPMPPLATPSSDNESSVSGSDETDPHLDEEVLIDEGTVVDLEQLRVPVPSQTEDHSEDEEDMNVADVIITNIFSLFWKSPETTGEVHTV
eukprot:jgi/Phyca11/533308/estExt2_fgenesh1_pg.C_PHYCAscaffold_120110